jgi:thioesterase domain-containing protein
MRDFRHLVPLRAANDRDGIPLFFIHGLGGWLFHLLPLIHQLPAHIPVYGLQGDVETALGRTFDLIAADYVREIRTFRSRGPWFIAGYSLGGVLAHEVARQLKDDSDQAVRLFLIDSYPRNLRAPWRWVMEIHAAATRGRRLLGRVVKSPLAALRHPEILQRMFRRLTRTSGSAPKPEGVFSNPFNESIARLVPRRYSGDATLFLAAGAGHPLKFGWQSLIRNPIDVQTLQGTHVSLLREGLAPLATALAGRYDHYSQNSNKEADGLGR